jgi:hypothetical protein
MFMQFFNVVYQLLVRSGHRVETIRDVGPLIGSLMVLTILPAVSEGILRDDDYPDDDDEGGWMSWLKWAALKSLTYGMGTIPVARDLVSYTVARLTGIGYGGSMRLTPLISPVESIIRTASTLFNEDKDWWDKSKAVTETAAFIAPYPMQFHTTAWNILDYMRGEEPDWAWRDLFLRKKR